MALIKLLSRVSLSGKFCCAVHSTPGSAPSFSAAVCHWPRWRLSLCVWPESMTSFPPRPGEALSQCGSCGSSQTRQCSSYLQGCGVTASFMRWHCLVLVDLTSLSPPSVFKGIWLSPSREETGWHLEKVASWSLSYGRSQDHLPSLLSTHVAKMKGPSVLGLVLWGFKLPMIRTRRSARLSAQINIYCLQGCVSAALAGPTLASSSNFSRF